MSGWSSLSATSSTRSGLLDPLAQQNRSTLTLSSSVVCAASRSCSLTATGVSAEVKVDNLRKTLDESSSYLLTSLPNIAWLLNLRGGDIAFTPIFYAYCIVAPFSLAVYVAPGQLTDAASRAIEDLGGSIHAIDGIWGDIKTSGKIVASGAISWALVSAIGEENLTVLSRSPVDSAEAIKNPVEIEGFKRAYLRDGAAWASWAAWLEETMGKGASISEWDAAEQLTAWRRSGEYFAGVRRPHLCPPSSRYHSSPTTTSRLRAKTPRSPTTPQPRPSLRSSTGRRRI